VVIYLRACKGTWEKKVITFPVSGRRKGGDVDLGGKEDYIKGRPSKWGEIAAPGKGKAEKKSEKGLPLMTGLRKSLIETPKTVIRTGKDEREMEVRKEGQSQREGKGDEEKGK